MSNTTPTSESKLARILIDFHGEGHPDYPYDHNGALERAEQAIEALYAQQIREAVDKTHYTLLERFNKGDEDAGKDIYINVDSDSWHVLIKQITAQLSQDTAKKKED